MRLTTFIALTGANETAMAAVTDQLTRLIAQRGEPIIVLQGVRTAFEATAINASSGELWRIGEDTSAPELDPLIDRTIDDSTPEGMARGVEQSLQEFLTTAPA